MKKLFMISMVFGFLLLSGCSESEMADATISVEGIYTSVALTITAQYTPVTATDTALPTSTLTPMPSPSEIPTLAATTSIPVSYSYSSSSVSNSCDSSTYISDVTISDGTVLAPGESFKKNMAVRK